MSHGNAVSEVVLRHFKHIFYWEKNHSVLYIYYFLFIQLQPPVTYRWLPEQSLPALWQLPSSGRWLLWKCVQRQPYPAFHRQRPISHRRFPVQPRTTIHLVPTQAVKDPAQITDVECKMVRRIPKLKWNFLSIKIHHRIWIQCKTLHSHPLVTMVYGWKATCQLLILLWVSSRAEMLTFRARPRMLPARYRRRPRTNETFQI